MTSSAKGSAIRASTACSAASAAGSPARQEDPKGRLVQVGPQGRGLVVDGQADQLVAEGGPAFSTVGDQAGADQGLQGPGRLGGAVRSATSAATSGRKRPPSTLAARR